MEQGWEVYAIGGNENLFLDKERGWGSGTGTWNSDGTPQDPIQGYNIEQQSKILVQGLRQGKSLEDIASTMEGESIAYGSEGKPVAALMRLENGKDNQVSVRNGVVDMNNSGNKVDIQEPSQQEPVSTQGSLNNRMEFAEIQTTLGMGNVKGLQYDDDGSLVITVPDTYSRSNLADLGIDDTISLKRIEGIELGTHKIIIPKDRIPESQEITLASIGNSIMKAVDNVVGSVTSKFAKAPEPMAKHMDHKNPEQLIEATKSRQPSAKRPKI